jgi:nitrogen fixation protein NifM
MADFPYLTLKLSHELFSKSPDGLSDTERQRVSTIAARQTAIEQRILGSANAALVVLPDASVEACIKDIRDRYPDEPEFEADLGRAGLDIESLHAAIERDLKVEAVLEQVAATTPAVSSTDVEIFYLQHLDRFRKPETRSLRHILITINDEVAGSKRDAAQAKIEAIRERLVKDIGRFSEQALKHSECPTAMNGGLLGKVPRGKLYEEVEAAAFKLAAGELSGIVESPLGFHIVLCDSSEAESQVPLAEVFERVREHLETSRRTAVQKAWIASLFQAA